MKEIIGCQALKYNYSKMNNEPIKTVELKIKQLENEICLYEKLLKTNPDNEIRQTWRTKIVDYEEFIKFLEEIK